MGSARRVGTLERHLRPSTTLAPSAHLLSRGYAAATGGASQPMWKKVRITAAGTGMRTVAKEEGEGHEVVMDEPQKMGGTDTGATPLHTLLASLAGCEHATAMLLARQMKIKLDSITFDIEGDYDVRGFRGVEGVPARYQTVRVKALVKTDAPQEKVDELAHLVHKKCPVAALFHDAGVQMDVSWTKV